MIKYRKALKFIDSASIKISNEKISILKSLNRVCAKNVLSPSKNPTFNNTAFDGFAVQSSNTKGITSKNKKKFKILKTIAAGDNPKVKKCKDSSVIEVMTGALVPKPFDSVIPVEKVKYFPSKQKPTHIILNQEIKKFSFIRFAGEDYNYRDVVIKKGEIVQPKHIMALTTLGINQIEVKKIPKIIFFGTGNEIVDFKIKNIPVWKVRNSNNYYIKFFGENLYLKIIDGGIIKDDDSERLKKELKKALTSNINIFITSGAISAGKFDFIPEIINQLGFKIYFKGVAIKPGKPIILSKFKGKDKLFFGLPGNPISCAAGFRFFIYPLIRNSLGMIKEKKFKGKLINKYLKRKEFTHFARCKMIIDKKGSVVLKVLKGQQSNRIKTFVEANCWGIFPEGKEKFKSGDFIEWLPLIPSS